MEKFNCSYSKIVPLTNLVPNPKNANKHPQEQIERLAKIIAFQGQRAPIVVSKRSGFIVKGHARMQAIQFLGWNNAAIDEQDYESEAQEYADCISDNEIARWAEFDLEKFEIDLKDLGDIDLDLDLFGLKDFDGLAEIEQLEPGCDEDEVPEAPKESIVKRGDLFELGRHRLLCGDSTMIDDFENLVNGESVGMVLTDPPYGINIAKQGSALNGKQHQYGNTKAKSIGHRPIIGDESIDGITDFLPLIEQVPIKIIWGGNHFPHLLRPSQGWIVWDKENTCNYSDAELAYTNVDCRLRIFKHKWSGFIRASERNEKRVHPTQKPIALAEWCFEEYGKNSDTVLDGFGGSGTTLIACEKTNRKCFMMELDEHYCQVIIERYLKFTGKDDVFLINTDGTKIKYTDLKEKQDI